MMRSLNILMLFVMALPLSAQYQIEGTVNLGPDWQPKIYLAAVQKLSDYYRTSPDMIVNTAPIDSNGYFVLRGDNLPDEQQFYRIYLMKKQNTEYDACFYADAMDHNFAHIILGNGAKISVAANPQSPAPFGEYSVIGDSDNELMRSLARIVFPSFYFYRIKFTTELQYSENKLHSDLINFADTCSNPLVALAAVNNIDFDEYFDRSADFYKSFGERLKREIPNSIYTNNYLLKVQYYANETPENGGWKTGFAQGLFVGLVLLWIGYLVLRQQYSKQQIAGNNLTSNASIAVQLTAKEKEILGLIKDGKSNKEIASALYVEVSTIKTHINKIYSKIGVNNRKAAQSFANQYLNSSISGV